MPNNDCKPLPHLSEKDIARFWSKVDRRGPDECWPWTAGTMTSGYGRLSLSAGGTRIMAGAHRLAYFLHYGEDAHPLWVLHHCDNPICCNGAHLFKGDGQDNFDDMRGKGRDASGIRHWSKLKPECLPYGDRNGSRTHPEKLLRGESCPWAKLTERQVQEIRSLFASGLKTKRAIASMFNVSEMLIYQIGKRLAWRHLE